MRTAIEKRERVEIIFSFDSEDEAKGWFEAYTAAVERESKRLQEQAGGEAVEAPAEEKGTKE